MNKLSFTIINVCASWFSLGFVIGLLTLVINDKLDFDILLVILLIIIVLCITIYDTRKLYLKITKPQDQFYYPKL
jgi:hypothetical protein